MITQEDRINRLRAEVSDRGRDIDNLLERIAAQDREIEALKADRDKYHAERDELERRVNLGDAIIAIDESGYGHMIIMLTTDDNKVRLQSEYDVLPELEYSALLPGLYYANMKIRPIYDDVEIDWVIVKPLYLVADRKAKAAIAKHGGAA